MCAYLRKLKKEGRKYELANDIRWLLIGHITHNVDTAGGEPFKERSAIDSAKSVKLKSLTLGLVPHHGRMKV